MSVSSTVTSAPPQAASRMGVLMPALVEAPFDYAVPAGGAIGDLVEANLANRTLIGVIWAEGSAQEIKPGKLKAVSRIIHELPGLSASFRQWIDWISDFTLAPKGAVLSLVGLAHAARVPKTPYKPTPFTITLPILTEGQQAVANALLNSSPFWGEVGRGAQVAPPLPHSPHPNPPPEGEGMEADLRKGYPLEKTLGYARALRQEMTDAEQLLWRHLRGEQFGIKFRKQHPVGPYIADFASLEPKIMIELDGGQHAQDDARAKDVARTSFLEIQGFTVLRFWNHEVLQQTDAVLEKILITVSTLNRTHPKGEGTRPTLLDGVTGSGKTEVYFHAIAEAIARGKQVLVMLPEIALTHQWLERFTKTFGAPPVLWHSRLTPAARARAWQAVARGEAPVVVGARSALFLPFAKLGLVVVDEEHDPSYKQEDGVLYHARDMAVVRAHFEQIPILLVSATPSLETLENVKAGKYRALHLPERFGAAGLPTVRLIDMRLDAPARGEFLSPTVKQAMLDTLARGEQVLFFLNRRGYAPLLLCRACGHRFQCADCSAWLVVHHGGRLECHHCGHKEAAPKACPACAAEKEKLAPCGPGIERVAEEVRGMFVSPSPMRGEDGRGADLAPTQPFSQTGPHPSPPPTGEGIYVPRLAVLSSDEAIAADTWAAIEKGEVDILVGTQMVAKGHHFPRLTLVVVVDADVGLSGADLRAGERTFQLLHQLGGRAGRGDLSGTVLIQTYAPEHPVMQSLVAHDRDRLMALEAKERKAGGWPPFGQLAAILLDGVDEAKVRNAGQSLARSAPQDARLTVLGPAPAPLSKLRGQYRYRILVKAKPGIHLQRTLREWLRGQKFSGVRVKVDVNPYYFM